jgi:myo-inositol-1(or 4)-monophosphatase
MVSDPYAAELEFAVETARLCGDLILRYRSEGFVVRDKPDRTVVTEADLASDALIRERIQAAYPGDSVLTEESGFTGGSSGRQWIIDPLDGTSNYSRGHPVYCVSIALWDAGEPAVGVVFLPTLGEMYAASGDTPATLNGKEIRVSGVSETRRAMINCYFDRQRMLEHGLRLFTRIARVCDGRVKITGSTAAMLCWVAAGRLDAQVKNSVHIWDYAAGILVLERAGGAVTDFAGDPLRTDGQSIVASNPLLHEELRRVAAEDTMPIR